MSSQEGQYVKSRYVMGFILGVGWAGDKRPGCKRKWASDSFSFSLPDGILIVNVDRQVCETNWKKHGIFFAPKRLQVLPYCGSPGKEKISAYVLAFLTFPTFLNL